MADNVTTDDLEAALKNLAESMGLSVKEYVEGGFLDLTTYGQDKAAILARLDAIDVINDDSIRYTFIDVAKQLYYPKLLSRYFVLKDWRDRGLIVKPLTDQTGFVSGNNTVVDYPKNVIELPRIKAKGMFFPEDSTSAPKPSGNIPETSVETVAVKGS